VEIITNNTRLLEIVYCDIYLFFSKYKLSVNLISVSQLSYYNMFPK